MRWLVYLLLGVAVATVAAVAGIVIVLLGGVWFLAGMVIGAVPAGLVVWVRARHRSQHLRELLDWLGEDLEARRSAELHAAQRIKTIRSQMPS